MNSTSRQILLFIISISIIYFVVGVYYYNTVFIVVVGIVGGIVLVALIANHVIGMIEARLAYQPHHPIGTHVYVPTIPRKRYGTVTAHSNSGYDIITLNNGARNVRRGGTARKHSTGRRPPNGQLETIMEKFHDGQQLRAVARGKTTLFPADATGKIGAMLFGLNEGELTHRLTLKNERERTEMEQYEREQREERELEQREREAVATSASAPLLSNCRNSGIEMLTLATNPRRSTDAKRSKMSRRRK